MAENELEGLLGNEKEGNEESIDLPAADGIAMLVAMDVAKGNADVARGVLNYLGKQSRLVDLQLKHFDEERRLAIAAARRKRISDRFRLGTQFFVAVLILSAVAGLGAVVYDALTDRGIKIEAFTVPPRLAEQGLTGQAVARKILDRISELQRGTTTVRAANSFANNWGKDIKLEVPETGISIGEISHWIHESIGRSTRVDGELYFTNAAVTVSIQVGDYPAIENSGPEADIPKLIEDAATRVYAQTQPYRYGFWLASQGQLDESNTVYRKLYAEGNLADRIWALNGLANNEESTEKYIVAEQRALSLDPHFLLGRLNMAGSEEKLGHPEKALSEYRAALADKQALADNTLSASGRALLQADGQQAQDELVCDYQAAVLIASQTIEKETRGGARDLEREEQALLLVELHDPAAAMQLVELIAAPKYLRSEARLSALRSRVAAERGDWAGALSELENFSASHPRDAEIGLRSRDPGFAAEIYARVSQAKLADEIVASIPNDNYNGWRARGRVAELRQDYPDAEQAFSQAARLAPSFAPAYEDWGDLLRATGDPGGALAKYSDASHRSPHWADPLKSWGDVLLLQGKVREALAKYDEALHYAPNWQLLKDARDDAAKHTT